MDWGDVPAWVAVVISLVATARAWAADRRAREATAGAASVEVSLDRIADLLERQQSRRDQVGTRSLPAAGPEFTAELLQGGRYRLRNVGAEVATGLTVSVDHPDRLVADLPDGVRLPPLASTEPFRVSSAWGEAEPGDLLVRCDQLPSGVTVLLPGRRAPRR